MLGKLLYRLHAIDELDASSVQPIEARGWHRKEDRRYVSIIWMEWMEWMHTKGLLPHTMYRSTSFYTESHGWTEANERKKKKVPCIIHTLLKISSPEWSRIASPSIRPNVLTSDLSIVCWSCVDFNSLLAWSSEGEAGAVASPLKLNKNPRELPTKILRDDVVATKGLTMLWAPALSIVYLVGVWLKPASLLFSLCVWTLLRGSSLYHMEGVVIGG